MRDRRFYMAVGMAVLFAVLAVVYFFFDPMDAVWMPKCLWKLTTGTDCPGCGSQRMAHALVHGEFREAWQANAFAMCMLPVIAFLLLLECFRERYPRLYLKVHSPVLICMLAGSVLCWWIVRNLV